MAGVWFVPRSSRGGGTGSGSSASSCPHRGRTSKFSLGGASCALGAWLLDSELDRKHGAARSTFEASTRLHGRVGGGILLDFVSAQLDFLEEHWGLRVVGMSHSCVRHTGMVACCQFQPLINSCFYIHPSQCSFPGVQCDNLGELK